MDLNILCNLHFINVFCHYHYRRQRYHHHRHHHHFITLIVSSNNQKKSNKSCSFFETVYKKLDFLSFLKFYFYNGFRTNYNAFEESQETVFLILSPYVPNDVRNHVFHKHYVRIGHEMKLREKLLTDFYSWSIGEIQLSLEKKYFRQITRTDQ